MYRKNTYLLIILTLMLGLFSTGCSKSFVQANIKTGELINPDANGRPSPVVVRVYELRSIGTFESADFFELYENDIAVLGKDLIHREEYTLRPGDSKEYLREPPPDVEYLAVIAAYHNLDKSTWKQFIAFPKNKKLKASISVDALAVSIKSHTKILDI